MILIEGGVKLCCMQVNEVLLYVDQQGHVKHKSNDLEINLLGYVL